MPGAVTGAKSGGLFSKIHLVEKQQQAGKQEITCNTDRWGVLAASTPGAGIAGEAYCTDPERARAASQPRCGHSSKLSSDGNDDDYDGDDNTEL